MIYTILFIVFILTNSSLTFAGTYQGLWVGQIELNKVNEAASKTNTVTLQPVKHVFDMTVLLHVDESGKVKLLKEVTMMQKNYSENGENMTRRVLITNDALLPNYDGIVRRDGKLTGIRLGSLAFDFETNQNELALAGSFSAGNSLNGSIVMAENHPSNPFRHYYHPDHQQGKRIIRDISFTINASQESNDPEESQFSLVGVYNETITGLHKIPLKINGLFSIQRISEVGKLNE